MRSIKFIVFLLVPALLIGCAVNAPHQPDVTYHLTILHTNDHHGHFWKNDNGEGGLAAQKTLVDRIRKEVAAKGGSVLLLSGGDVNTGVPESDLLDAKPDFMAMSAMGYDAMVLGNHEFDNPLSVLAKQKKWATFPFLSANTFKAQNQALLYDDYDIFSCGPLKVAVFGLTTPDTPILALPDNVKGLTFKDPVETATKLVPMLAKKATLIIALTHLGYYDGGGYGSNAPGAVTLARSVAGIDVIVGGHSHTRLTQAVKENGTLIVQAGDNGKYLGRLDLAVKNGEIVQSSYRLIPVNLKKKVEKDGKTERVLIETEIPEDPAMLALLKPYMEKGQDELGKVIGKALGGFQGEREVVRSQETNLGNLIARVQRLKAVAAAKKEGSGAFAQFDNIKVVMNGDALSELRVGGQPVKDNKTYKLTVNSFTAAGGDGYPAITAHPHFVDTGYIDADVLKEYIEQHSPLDPADFAPAGDVIRN